MSQTKLKVIAYSDYICPFCYIGYHRIEKLKKEYNLTVEWRPFEIHPETPAWGVLKEDLAAHKGYLEGLRTHIKRLADEDGLTLKFSEFLPNSRLALFISEYARKEGKFEEFHKLVLEAYWFEGKDIGSIDLLLDLAESIGLDKNEIDHYLHTNEPFEILQKSLNEIRKMGINGVPAFIIGNRLIFGAQPYDVFKKVINIILDEESKKN
ncbi:MAG: DsbA family protein [Promethearchaeota archaeon]